MAVAKIRRRATQQILQNRLLHHHENQSEAAAAADDHAAWQDQSQTTMSIPNSLLPAVRELLSKHAPP